MEVCHSIALTDGRPSLETRVPLSPILNLGLGHKFKFSDEVTLNNSKGHFAKAKQNTIISDAGFILKGNRRIPSLLVTVSFTGVG